MKFRVQVPFAITVKRDNCSCKPNKRVLTGTFGNDSEMNKNSDVDYKQFEEEKLNKYVDSTSLEKFR